MGTSVQHLASLVNAVKLQPLAIVALITLTHPQLLLNVSSTG